MSTPKPERPRRAAPGPRRAASAEGRRDGALARPRSWARSDPGGGDGRCSGRRASATSRWPMSRGRRASPRRRCTTTSRTSPTCTPRSPWRGSRRSTRRWTRRRTRAGRSRSAWCGWPSWASSGWRRTSTRRTSMPTSTSTMRTTSSSTRRWTSSRSRSSAASRRPGRPTRDWRPKAASELLGGVLFSLIFTPGDAERRQPAAEGPRRAGEARDPAVPRRLLVARARRGPARLRAGSRRSSRAREARGEGQAGSTGASSSASSDGT